MQILKYGKIYCSLCKIFNKSHDNLLEFFFAANQKFEKIFKENRLILSCVSAVAIIVKCI